MSRFLSLQILINSGMAWKLEGSVGRECMRAMENGDCMLGTVPHQDYWGNRVPSRFEVKEGTKGSRSWVVQNNSEEHAAMLESLPNEATAEVLSAIFC